MRTILDGKGQELAVVLGTEDYLQCSDKRFFSAEDDALQVGSLFFEPGSSVTPHRHKPKDAVSTPMEVLLVLCGDPEASIFDEGGVLVETVGLVTGDILIQKRGGHGFTFPHKTALLEVKRGPYRGKESDKEPI